MSTARNARLPHIRFDEFRGATVIGFYDDIDCTGDRARLSFGAKKAAAIVHAFERLGPAGLLHALRFVAAGGQVEDALGHAVSDLPQTSSIPTDDLVEDALGNVGSSEPQTSSVPTVSLGDAAQVNAALDEANDESNEAA